MPAINSYQIHAFHYSKDTPRFPDTSHDEVLGNYDSLHTCMQETNSHLLSTFNNKKMTFRKCWRLWLTLSIAGAMQTFIERTGTCFSGLWKPTQAVLANIYALLPAWTGFLSVLSGAPLSKCYHYS